MPVCIEKILPAFLPVAGVEPFLVEYYGTGGSQSVGDPLNTVTTKDRHALILPEVVVEGQRYRLDIPVLRIDDTDAFKHRIDYDRLVARLLHGTPAPLEATQVPAP